MGALPLIIFVFTYGKTEIKSQLATLSNNYSFLLSCYLSANIINRKMLEQRHFKCLIKENKTFAHFPT